MGPLFSCWHKKLQCELEALLTTAVQERWDEKDLHVDAACVRPRRWRHIQAWKPLLYWCSSIRGWQPRNQRDLPSNIQTFFLRDRENRKKNGDFWLLKAIRLNWTKIREFTFSLRLRLRDYGRSSGHLSNKRRPKLSYKEGLGDFFVSGCLYLVYILL